MASYVIPAMPLTARVWFFQPQLPAPDDPHDAEITCSLSPVNLRDFLADGILPNEALRPTHIIRARVNSFFADSLGYLSIGEPWPCTVFEVPSQSQHFYAALFAHQVGAGFDNWFSRVYVCRMAGVIYPNTPVFTGWI